jgi:hypothetical protein
VEEEVDADNDIIYTAIALRLEMKARINPQLTFAGQPGRL